MSVPTAGGVEEQPQGVQLSTQLLASYARVLNSEKTTALIAASIDNRLAGSQRR